MHVNNKGQIFKSVFFTIDFLNWLLWSLNVKSIVKCIRKLLANKYFKFFYAIHLYIIWPLYAEVFLKMTILFFLFHVAIFFKKNHIGSYYKIEFYNKIEFFDNEHIHTAHKCI